MEVLWHTFSAMKGEVIAVTKTNGDRYVGVLESVIESDLQIRLRYAQLVNRSIAERDDLQKICNGTEYIDAISIGSNELAHLYAPKINYDENCIDTDPKNGDSVTERELQPWDAGQTGGDDDGDAMDLTWNASGDDESLSQEFDQFKGKETTYCEDIYTTALAKDDISQTEREAAATMEKEIFAKESDNVHVLTDRGQRLTQISKDESEEAVYSSVQTAAVVVDVAATATKATKPPLKPRYIPTATDSFVDNAIANQQQSTPTTDTNANINPIISNAVVVNTLDNSHNNTIHINSGTTANANIAFTNAVAPVTAAANAAATAIVMPNMAVVAAMVMPQTQQPPPGIGAIAATAANALADANLSALNPEANEFVPTVGSAPVNAANIAMMNPFQMHQLMGAQQMPQLMQPFGAPNNFAFPNANPAMLPFQSNPMQQQMNQFMFQMQPNFPNNFGNPQPPPPQQ